MEKSYNIHGNEGFSLVELSIVLVILGLLVGGVLSGQSLIRAAELRAVPTEFQRYTAAGQTFRDKYMAIPGDMPNATKFWGEAATGSACATTSTGNKKTCDGNGNGIVETGYANSNEGFRFWQHLANAALIEGSYSGVSGPSHATHHAIIGTNIPASKLGKAGFNPNPLVAGAISPQYFLREDNTTVYNYGAIYTSGTSSASTYGPVLKPEEAWNIDTKIDDGKPGYGWVTTFTKTAAGVDGSGSGSAFNPDCVDADTASAASYSLSDSKVLCSLVLKTGL